MADLNDPTIDERLEKCIHKLEVARITLFTERHLHNSILDELILYIQSIQVTAEAGETGATQLLKKSKRDLKIYRRDAAWLFVRLGRRVAKHVNELEILELEKRMGELTRELEQCAERKEGLEKKRLRLRWY